MDNGNMWYCDFLLCSANLNSNTAVSSEITCKMESTGCLWQPFGLIVPWLVFCKDQKHAQCDWVARGRTEESCLKTKRWGAEEQEQYQSLEAGSGGKSREWGHVEQPPAAGGGPSQSSEMGRARLCPQPSGGPAVPRWPNVACMSQRSLVRATCGKGPTVTCPAAAEEESDTLQRYQGACWLRFLL